MKQRNKILMIKHVERTIYHVLSAELPASIVFYRGAAQIMYNIIFDIISEHVNTSYFAILLRLRFRTSQWS